MIKNLKITNNKFLKQICFALTILMNAPITHANNSSQIEALDEEKVELEEKMDVYNQLVESINSAEKEIIKGEYKISVSGIVAGVSGLGATISGFAEAFDRPLRRKNKKNTKNTLALAALSLTSAVLLHNTYNGLIELEFSMADLAKLVRHLELKKLEIESQMELVNRLGERLNPDHQKTTITLLEVSEEISSSLLEK